MKRLFFLVVIGFALAVASWQILKPADLAKADAAHAASGKNNPQPGTQTMGSGMFAPNGLKPASAPSKGKAGAVSLRSAYAIEFESGLNLKKFYDRYAANPQGADAETKFLAAAALETCQWKVRNQVPTEAAKQKFMDRLKENDPNNNQRIEAYNQINAACEGFQNLGLTPADTSRLYAEAAAAGNPGAKAAVAAELYREQSRNARNIEERRMSEDQLSLVRDALASGDPFAIRRAGQLLTYESSQLTDRKLGAEGDLFNPRDLGPAWTFLACDRGANCGADANRVLQGCASQGACGYTSLQSYMQFNELSPNAYANAQRYNAMIADAIAQGRWDLLGIAPGMGRTVVPANPVTPATGTRPAGTPPPPPGPTRHGG